jgi:protein-disulfide isomerase
LQLQDHSPLLEKEYLSLMTRQITSFVVLGGIIVAALAGVTIARPGRATGRAPATTHTLTPDAIAQFVRDRFSVPATTTITVEPLHPSALSEFLETQATVNDGKQSKVQPIYVTKDGQYVVVGNVFALGANPKDDIIQHVRDISKLPPGTEISLGAGAKSPYPGFEELVISAMIQGQKQTAPVFTLNHKVGILGSVLPYITNPRVLINLTNQPAEGPANAAVTLVEYADLQCPTCAKFHEFLQKDAMPKYGNKLRIVYKEFPLPLHDWSMTAAIANECAYRIKPSAFVPYRTLIFANQQAFNVANVRDLLLQYGEQTGLDKLKLSACIDSKATLPRIQADKEEGEKLGISSTPTSIVNKRFVVGFVTADQFDKIMAAELASK